MTTASVVAADFAAGLMSGRHEQSWRVDGACRDAPTVDFFPERAEPTEPAKAVCAVCPAHTRTACLNHALSWPERVGVWGGTSERERRAMRRAGRGAPLARDEDAAA